MKQTIIFDLDDTLIYCNKYFNLVVDQFIDAMTTWFNGYDEVTSGSVRDKQIEIDIAGVQVLGFKAEHFPQSFLDTYTYFSTITGRKESKVEKDLLWKLGLSVYEQEAEPYPDMESTLDKLAAEGHDLHLYTGGEPLIQSRKIERLNLERYFGEQIYIRRHKDISALEEILQTGSFDRSITWMIGNSIRTDVVPALTTGINAIYIPTEQEWAFNMVPIEVEPKGAFLNLNHLREVPDAINGYVAT